MLRREIMKLYYFFSFVILSTLTLSCTFDQQSSNVVTYSKYKEKSFIETTTGFCVDSVFDSSRKLFQYFNEDSALIYRLDINISSDTTIVFNGVVILQKNKKQFLFNDKDVDIYKYYYDIVSQHDEEAFIFIDHLNGIVGINYFPWGLSVFPERDNTIKGFKNVVFESENKSFYEW
jgi:uncharacterized protein YdeI (BOF family)